LNIVFIVDMLKNKLYCEHRFLGFYYYNGRSEKIDLKIERFSCDICTDGICKTPKILEIKILKIKQDIRKKAKKQGYKVIEDFWDTTEHCPFDLDKKLYFRVTAQAHECVRCLSEKDECSNCLRRLICITKGVVK